MKLNIKNPNQFCFYSNSSDATQHLGYVFGSFLFNRFVKEKNKNGFFLIALIGEYGAGKTVFAKGVCQNLRGVKNSRVTSPTFIIMNIYPPNANTGKRVIHIDACRIKSERDFIMLGTEDFYSNSIVLVEWADKILNCLPDERIDLFIKINGENKRILNFVNKTAQVDLFADFKKVVENRTFKNTFSL